MSRTPTAVALVAATLLLLGGCGDDDPKPNIPDPPTSAPTSTTPTSPSTSSTVSPTQSSLSARESVDAWLDAWTAAMQTGNTTLVRELSTDACDSCTRLIAKVEEVYGKGGHYETDGWTASHVREAPDSVERAPSFVMQVEQARRKLFGEDGQLVDTASQTRQPMRMTFHQQGSRWLLIRLEILE
jgi:hypothetical protein